MKSIMIDILPAIRINELVGKAGTTDKELHLAQADIIDSELGELFASIKRESADGMRDDVMDLIFTVAGMIGIGGLASYTEKDWSTIVASQYAKFDYNEEDALKTLEYYNERGVVVNLRDIFINVEEMAPYAEYMPPHIKQKLEQAISEERETIVATASISAKKQLDHEGRDIPAGKWMKSYRFKNVKFTGTVPVVGKFA